MRNPLNESPGKGDAPRNCHNPKFRKNYDSINWGEKYPSDEGWRKAFDKLSLPNPWIPKIKKRKKKK